MGQFTDQHWEQWGKTDPYFGVLSADEFHRDALNEQTLETFFASGEMHVKRVMETIHETIQPGFAPETVLDYGCGVGRLVIPFANRFAHVTGVDISPSMLAEMQHNLETRKISNADGVLAEKLATMPAESFDLIHSFIVLQHIPVKIGQLRIHEMLRVLKPGGVGALHVTISSPGATMQDRITKLRRKSRLVHGAINILRGRKFNAPGMQMNSYSLNWLANELVDHHCNTSFIRYTLHGNVRGAMIFFRKDAESSLW